MGLQSSPCPQASPFHLATAGGAPRASASLCVSREPSRQSPPHVPFSLMWPGTHCPAVCHSTCRLLVCVFGVCKHVHLRLLCLQIQMPRQPTADIPGWSLLRTVLSPRPWQSPTEPWADVLSYDDLAFQVWLSSPLGNKNLPENFKSLRKSGLYSDWSAGESVYEVSRARRLHSLESGGLQNEF